MYLNINADDRQSWITSLSRCAYLVDVAGEFSILVNDRTRLRLQQQSIVPEPLDKPTFKDRRIKHIDLVMPPNEVDQCTAKAQKALFVVEYNQRHSKHQIFTLCMDSSQCQLENRWRVSRGHFQYIFDVLSVVACVAEPWFIPRSPFVDFEKRSTYNIYMLRMWSMRQAHVCVTVG